MVDGNVVGQAVVLSGFVLGNGAGTFSYHIFSDVEPQFATDPQSERSYGDERSPFKENIPGSWDSELGRQGVSSEEALVFAGGTKEMLEVKAGDFLYAEAKGNYVKVGYRSDSDKEKKITWRLLRATMKQAEEAVSACPFIIRCHRAFLVNIRMVVKVDGNSQGYKLNLEGCEEDVPVSRAYAKEVKALIENRTKS